MTHFTISSDESKTLSSRIDQNNLEVTVAVVAEGVGVAVSVGVAVVSGSSLDASVGGRGGETGVDSNALGLGLSLTLVELADAIGSSGSSYRLVAGSIGPVGIVVWAVSISSSAIGAIGENGGFSLSSGNGDKSNNGNLLRKKYFKIFK